MRQITLTLSLTLTLTLTLILTLALALALALNLTRIEGTGEAMRCVQLQRRLGLQGDGEVLQRAGDVRGMGVFRRVQPHRR